jgi:hypothetical protein
MNSRDDLAATTKEGAASWASRGRPVMAGRDRPAESQPCGCTRIASLAAALLHPMLQPSAAGFAEDRALLDYLAGRLVEHRSRPAYARQPTREQ